MGMAYCSRCDKFIGNFAETPTMGLMIERLGELHEPNCPKRKIRTRTKQAKLGENDAQNN